MMRAVCGSSDLNIVYTSRYFRLARKSFRSIPCSLDRRPFPEPASVPFPWDKVRHPTVVLFFTGTLFNADATFIANVSKHFGARDFQVIMSIGANVSAAELGAPPLNVIVEAHCPAAEVLQRASAFVTHADE